MNRVKSRSESRERYPMQSRDKKQCLSVGKAAMSAGVSTRTVLRWFAQGKVTGYKTKGGHRRVSADSLRLMKPYKRKR